jgi:hypothetical protein
LFLTSDTGRYIAEIEEVTLELTSRKAFKTQFDGLAQADPPG